MVDPEANIIVGAVVDEALEGEIHVAVATGFARVSNIVVSGAAPAVFLQQKDGRSMRAAPGSLNSFVSANKRPRTLLTKLGDRSPRLP